MAARHPKELTPEQKKKALAYLMLQGGVAATPAGNHLFLINDKDPVMLDKKRCHSFMYIVMQLLYLSQRARLDIQMAVSFLCGHLSLLDIDDYKKAHWVIKYLRGMLDMPLRLSRDGHGVIQWWIDASFVVHPNMRGHTGGTMSLGKGSTYSTSTKQKLVAQSSTESEVIGVHDILPQTIWTNNFLKEQGMEVKRHWYTRKI